MPYFIAAQSTGVQVPIFKKLGKPNLMPGSVDDLPMFMSGNPHYKYKISMSYLASIARMQLKNNVGFLQNEYFNAFKTISNTSYPNFTRPVGNFFFQSLTNEDVSFLKQVGLREIIGRTNAFQGSPDFNSISDIYRLGPIDGRTSVGCVSADGYLAFVYAVKGLMILTDLPNGYVSGTGVDVVTKSDGNSATKDRMEIEVGGPLRSVTSSWKPFSAESDEMFEEWSFTSGPKTSSKKIVGAVVQMNHTSTLPDAGGIYLPYFDGLVNPDKSLIVHVFQKYLLPLLGDTEEVASKLWTRLRPGFRNLSFTEGGKALSHAYCCINMGIESGAYNHILFQGPLYKGVIVQSDFLVGRICGETIAVLPRERLLEDIGFLNKHDVALGKVLGLINGVVNKDGMPVFLKALEDINTSRKLVSTLALEFKSIPPETMEAINATKDDLIFDDRYAPLNSQSIRVFINFVLTGDEAILKDYPAWISTTLLKNLESRVYRGLSIFGPRAPVVSYGGRDKMTFTIPSSMNTQDNNLSERDGKRLLQYLSFQEVPVNSAAISWNSVLSTGMIHLPPGRKGKTEFTNSQMSSLKIGSNPDFDVIYGMLKNASINVRAGMRGGKRSRADDDEQSGPSGSAKRSKKAAKEIADVL